MITLWIKIRSCPQSFLTPAPPMSHPPNNQFSYPSQNNYFCLFLDFVEMKASSMLKLVFFPSFIKM